MKLEIPIDDISGEIVGNTIIICSEHPLKILSSAVLNGGLINAKTIINHQVSRDYHHSAPEDDLKRIVEEMKLPVPTIGLMTAADVRNVSITNQKYNTITVSAVITAGISNPATAGDDINISQSMETINIILLIDGNLTDANMANAVITATEAKTAALKTLDIRSPFSGSLATGTTTDSIVVACTGRGELMKYAGTGTKLGEKIGKVIKEGVKIAIRRQENLEPNRKLIKRFEERGITFDDLVSAGLELYVLHPSVEPNEKQKVIERATIILKDELEKALSDLNVCSLAIAGMRLEEDGKLGLIPGFSSSSFNNDPVHFVADEILGMAISNYIAGTNGIFEFIRFDKAKPGIIAKLGPVLDDIIGGIVAGASSKMYARAGEEDQESVHHQGT